MMNVKVDQLVKFLGEEFVQELKEWRGAEHDIYGYVELVSDDTIKCSRLLELSIGHGIAPATKLFTVGHGGGAVTAYQISAGMIFVSTNADGDVWTKDGYILTGSDIKLIRRTYEKQLPLDYASDKGLYVW